MKKRTFMVISPDGTTFDNSGEEHQNIQILDIIQAETFVEAENIARSNNYGDFPHWQVVEYFKPEQVTLNRPVKPESEEEIPFPF